MLNEKIAEQVAIIEKAKKKIKDMIAQEGGGECKVQVSTGLCYSEDYMLEQYVYFTDLIEEPKSDWQGVDCYEYKIEGN